LFDRAVATFRLFAQRHQDNVIEIAFELAAQFFGLGIAQVADAFARHRLRLLVIGGGDAAT
jgi:hypothetical protein